MTRRTERVKIGKQKTRQLPNLVPQYRYEYKCTLILIVKTGSLLWDICPLISTRFSGQRCLLVVGSAANHYPTYNVQFLMVSGNFRQSLNSPKSPSSLKSLSHRFNGSQLVSHN